MSAVEVGQTVDRHATCACLPSGCERPQGLFLKKLEPDMAKPKLASMGVGALIKLRDDISAVLARRAEALKKELRSLGEDYKEVGRIAIYGKKKATRKVAAKYRHPRTGETWAGRGAQPRWLTAEIKAGKKRDDFLIVKPARKKKARRKK
ncbi:MAG: H-NS family nucleoid-associated regulatory protein [Xanthobacteraceae bacterium]